MTGLARVIDGGTSANAMKGVLTGQSPEATQRRYDECQTAANEIRARAGDKAFGDLSNEDKVRLVECDSTMAGIEEAWAALGYDVEHLAGRAINDNMLAGTTGNVFTDLQRAGMLDGDKTAAGTRATLSAVSLFGQPSATLFQTTDGYPPAVQRTDRIAYQPLPALDVLAAFGDPIPTSEAEVKYLDETLTDKAAAERAEGAAAAEADIETVERSIHQSSVAVKLPVTEETLADDMSARRYLDTRLPRLVRDRANTRLVSGAGTKPNVNGVVGSAAQATGGAKAANDVTAAKSGNVTADPLGAIEQALTKVITTGHATPTHVLINPNVWSRIRRERVKYGADAGATTGEFVLGNPAQGDFGRDLFGVPLIPSNALADDSATNPWAVAGDFDRFAELWLRKDATVEAGYENDGFGKAILTLRCIARMQAILPAARRVHSHQARGVEAFPGRSA